MCFVIILDIKVFYGVSLVDIVCVFIFFLRL